MGMDEVHEVSINFLDVTVSVNGEEFETDLYCKPNNCHQFLEFNSAHPIQNKKSIVYSQGLRIKRLCSKKDAFEKHLESFRSWFGQHGYLKKLVDNQIRRVLESKPEQLFESCTKTGIGVPLVVTYHPRFHNLSNTIRKLFTYFYAEEQVKKVFTPTPFVSLRSGYSLRSNLVHAKVYPLIGETGLSCCGKSRCETCFNIQETDNF